MKSSSVISKSSPSSKSLVSSHLSVSRIAFPKLRRKPSFDGPTRFEAISHEKETYCNKATIHAGMKNKPLVPYTPNCLRSRLVASSSAIPKWNITHVEIGNKDLYNAKKVYKTSYQYILDAIHVKTTSNPGIFAERTRWYKSRCEDT